MWKAAIVWLVFILPGAALAQAFGVQMGAPVSRYGGKPLSGSKFSFIIQVPEPNSEFESYTAVATPETGICKVTGIGITHRNDYYGTDTRYAFNRLKQALTKRYGNNKSFNFIKVDALWDGPREWVWSIYKKERVLSAYWDSEERSRLPSDVTSIALHTRAINPTSPYVVINYEFTNMEACVRIIGVDHETGL